jgi:threonyl-tRNA synthetase
MLHPVFGMGLFLFCGCFDFSERVNQMIQVTLKGGVVKAYEAGITAGQVAADLGAGLLKAACAARVDGQLCDLRTPLTKDCELAILTFEDEEGKKTFWHTASHVLAQAVRRLFPEARLGVGPAIDGGFFYDFAVSEPFTKEDLEKIEAEMLKIVKEDAPVYRKEPSDAEIDAMFAGEPFKQELVAEHRGKGDQLSIYGQGEFFDLCAGPHLLSTGPLKAVKLTQATAAYWRGDAANASMSRVYGTAFPKAAMLAEHLAAIEEAKRRDHRRIGRELDLFDLYDEGPGFPFFLPKGMVLRNILENFWREEHARAGYQEIRTPIILDAELWHRSGHWDHYKNNMYFTKIDEGDFALKPMNCPGGMLVYKRRMHSYRDLPQRIAEMGLVHRHELSGALHGLMRVRCFTQDDAHIFMTPEQIEDEIVGVIHLIDHFYKVFGFDYRVELSTRPKDSMGSDEQWELATRALQSALDHQGIEYKINEGDGAFYGPKIDFHLRDCIGRTWQCGTIQLDFQMPERFELEYTGPDGEKHRPVMIHRVAFGSIERFIAILTEQYAGAFPAWLAPVQAAVLPISENHHAYAREVTQKLAAAGFRVEMDDRNEKIGYKIREAQLKKYPYMLIVGEKEAEAGTVSVRSHRDGEKGQMPLEDFAAALAEEVHNRVL